MDKKDIAFILFALFCLSIPLAYEVHLSLPKKIIYDCRVAEISPDVPVQVKQLCRDKMKENK